MDDHRHLLLAPTPVSKHVAFWQDMRLLRNYIRMPEKFSWGEACGIFDGNGPDVHQFVSNFAERFWLLNSDILCVHHHGEEAGSQDPEGEEANQFSEIIKGCQEGASSCSTSKESVSYCQQDEAK